MPTFTTAASHRSKATLQQVTRLHASSRALSPETRDVFASLADGCLYTAGDVTWRDDVHDAFFEAATSCATRAGQSHSRRVMASDLAALRDAVLSGDSIVDVSRTVTVTITAPSDAAVGDVITALRDANLGAATLAVSEA